MKRMVGIIQENMFSNEEIQHLESGLKNLYQKNYSSEEKLNVIWMVMPKGYAYSERKLSHAVVLLIEVNEDITQEKREELMSLFSKFLLENFKVSPLDSVITVANSSFVQAFSDSQSTRIAPLYRPFIRLKMMMKALASKRKNGYLKLAVRL